MDLFITGELPLISVIMSVYNAEKFVGEAIESVLHQTFTNFEFIIIDDGSTDNSFAIIQQYIKNDSRITVVKNNENLGVSSALNNGISMAKGRYVARMDADDISFPDRFLLQLEEFKKNPELLVVGSDAIRESGGNRTYLPTQKYPYSIQWNLLTKQTGLHHPTVMFERKEVLKRFGKYPEKFPFSQDRALWLKISFAKPEALSNINKPLIVYRRTSDSVGMQHKYREEKIASNYHFLTPYINRITDAKTSKEIFLTLFYKKYFSLKISWESLIVLRRLFFYYREKQDISTEDLSYIRNNYLVLSKQLIKRAFVRQLKNWKSN